MKQNIFLGHVKKKKKRLLGHVDPCFFPMVVRDCPPMFWGIFCDDRPAGKISRSTMHFCMSHAYTVHFT